jgi:hypothetical protein
MYCLPQSCPCKAHSTVSTCLHSLQRHNKFWLRATNYSPSSNTVLLQHSTTRRAESHNVYIYLLSYSRSWALLEEPPIVQPLKNFPIFYGTRKFDTVFIRALHWSLFWAISIQSIPSQPISLRSILVLSFHLCLGLPSGLQIKYMKISF